MPLGETIGRAYVKILADGTGFSDDVRRQMRENEPGFRRAGERHSAAYHDGFDRENAKRGRNTSTRLEHALAKGAGRFDAVGGLFGDHLMDGLRDQLEKRFGDIGTAIFSNLKDALESGDIDFNGLLSRLRDIRPEVAKATRDIASDQVKQFDRLSDSIDRYSNTLLKSRHVRQNLVRELHDLARAMPNVITHTDEFRDRVRRLRDQLEGGSNLLKRFGNVMSGVGDKTGKLFGRGSRNDFLNFFGGFMSIVPTAIGAIGDLGQALSDFARRGMRDFTAAWDAAGGGVRGFVSAAGELVATGLPGIIALAAAVAIAVESLFAVLGIAASAISLLTGAVLALAGSIGFALAGALVVVSGALVPFAAALGVAALAFGKLDKKSKVFKTLKKDWSDLQKVARDSLFGKNQQNLGAISDILKGFTPLVRGVGKALGGLLVDFGKFTKTKPFKNLMSEIGTLIPGMVTQLGHIFGNLAIGIGEAFVAAGPAIKEFLGWLEDVSKKFADAGKKGTGKNGKGSKLGDFFTDAIASAKIIAGLIKAVAEDLGLLFKAGKPSGDNLFGDLKTKAEELGTWLKDPKNQAKLKKWFEDAEAFARKVGTAILAIGTMIEKLDTPTNRQILTFLVDTFTKTAQFVGDTSVKLDELNGKLEVFGQNWKTQMEKLDQKPTGERVLKGGPFELIEIAWKNLKTNLAPIDWSVLMKPGKDVLGPWFAGLGGPGSGFALLKEKLGTFFTTTLPGWASQLGGTGSGWERITQGFQTSIDSISTWWDQLMLDLKTSVSDTVQDISDQWDFMVAPLTTAITSIKQAFVDLWTYLVGGSLIPDLVNEIIRLFTEMPSKIAAGIGNLATIFATWVAGIPAAVRTVVSQITTAFSGLAGKVFTKAGSIASSFGVWAAGLPAKARTLATTVSTGFSGLAKKMITRAGSIASAFGTWVASLAGRARSTATSIASGFAGLARRMIVRAGSIASALASWLAALPGRARTVASQVASAFAGLARKMIQRAGSIASAFASWASGIARRAGQVADDIVRQFSGLASRIVAAIGTIVPKIRMPSIPRPVVDAIVKVAKGATGFVTTGPQVRMIGEAGPEAVVPLNRPLSQVDPAVRMLSAFAQGKLKLPSGGGTGRTIDIGGITINTPTEDPRAVASEVVAHMAVASYF